MRQCRKTEEETKLKTGWRYWLRKDDREKPREKKTEYDEKKGENQEKEGGKSQLMYEHSEGTKPKAGWRYRFRKGERKA